MENRLTAGQRAAADPGSWPGLLRRTQTLLEIVNRSWSTRRQKGQRCKSPQNALSLRLLKCAVAFKPANLTLRSPKEIATFSTHEASRLPTVAHNQWPDLSVSPPPQSQPNWPLDEQQLTGRLPSRQLSMKGRLFIQMFTGRESILLLHTVLLIC